MAGRRSSRWTAAEDQVLRESTALSHEELAALLGRTPWGVAARRLKLKEGPRRGRAPWTAEEDALLLSDAPLDAVFAALPGRSMMSLNSRRHYLTLRNATTGALPAVAPPEDGSESWLSGYLAGLRAVLDATPPRTKLARMIRAEIARLEAAKRGGGVESTGVSDEQHP